MKFSNLMLAMTITSGILCTLAYAETSPATQSKPTVVSKTALDIPTYINEVNNSQWSEDMKVNTAMTVKIQVLLGWNNISVGAIDGGWGSNSKQALLNFQRKHGLDTTGRMNNETWQALTGNIDSNQPIITTYTITKADANITTAALPKTFALQEKQKSLPHQSVAEMLAERFHMDIAYLKKLNPTQKFEAGDEIYVINQPYPLKQSIDKLVASRKYNTLFAYNNKQLIATYPATIGNTQKAAPLGIFTLANKINNPWYKATINKDGKETSYMLPPGPNNPIGIVWLGLSKPSCGISGMELPEIVGRLDATGCIKLTNWDADEVAQNIINNATVEIQ